MQVKTKNVTKSGKVHNFLDPHPKDNLDFFEFGKIENLMTPPLTYTYIWENPENLDSPISNSPHFELWTF